jgi:hypothetical protein
MSRESLHCKTIIQILAVIESEANAPAGCYLNWHFSYKRKNAHKRDAKSKSIRQQIYQTDVS